MNTPDTPTEQWLPLPGWEGRYEASSEGQVRSVSRISPQGRRVGGKILSQTLRGFGYQHVSLHNNATGERSFMTVHKAVMLAFVGPRPEGQEIRHIDGNPLNNKLSNLTFGTRSENILDAVRHGTNLNAAKTHCIRGHAFTPENTYLKGSTGRDCRKCQAVRRQKYEARNKAARNARPRREAA
jgi:hypothetical protein